MGPEPGDSVIDLIFSRYVRGRALGLIDGILHRFQAHAIARVGIVILRAIADGVNILVTRAQMVVDADSVVASESGVAREFVIGIDADADNDEIGFRDRAIAEKYFDAVT